MRLAKRAHYALRLMIDLADHAKPGAPTILREIAHRQQISKRYLEQLATVLKNANLVSVSSGRGGGYSLPRSPEKIRVSEIIRATIGEINVVSCVKHQERCRRADSCPTRRMWCELNLKINGVFERFSLADLCEKGLKVVVPEENELARCSNAMMP